MVGPVMVLRDDVSWTGPDDRAGRLCGVVCAVWWVRCGVWLGGEAVGTAEEEDRFPQRVQPEQQHQRSAVPHTQPAVWWASVPEAVEVVLHRLGTQTLFGRLLEQNLVAVFALRAGGRLHPFPDEVEAQRDVLVVARSHVVEGPDAGGVVGHEDELVSGLLLDVCADAAFPLGVEVLL